MKIENLHLLLVTFFLLTPNSFLLPPHSKTMFSKTLSLFLSLAILSGTSLLAQGPQTYDPNATAESLGLEPFHFPDDFYPNYPWDMAPSQYLPHETYETSLPGYRDCGFTIAGFTVPEHLWRFKEVEGLKTIVMLPGAPWATLTDEEIDERVRSGVEQTKDHECIVGYYILDEPGAKTFPALAKAVAAVKKYAPGKLAYINLFPRYATTNTVENPNSQLETDSFTEYLERYVQEVKPQFISYDNYMVEYSDDMNDLGQAAIYYADLLEIRGIALKYDLPFWNIVSSNRIQDLSIPPSQARFAFQAYTTLAAGARGIGWFTYYHRDYFAKYSPVDKEGRRTIFWQYQQAINKHINTLGPIMNRLTSTGVYFTTPTPTPGLPELPGKLISKVDSTASPRGFIAKKPAFMVGEFVDREGNDYVMLVNLSFEHSARFHLETVKDYASIEKFSPMDGSLSPLITDATGEWVLPGHGLLLKLNAK